MKKALLIIVIILSVTIGFSFVHTDNTLNSKITILQESNNEPLSLNQLYFESDTTPKSLIKISLNSNFANFNLLINLFEAYGSVTTDNVDQIIADYNQYKMLYFVDLKTEFIESTNFSISRHDMFSGDEHIYIISNHYISNYTDIDEYIVDIAGSNFVKSISISPLGGIGNIGGLDDPGGISNNFGTIEDTINLSYMNDLDCDDTNGKYSGCGINIGIHETRAQGVVGVGNGFIDPNSDFFLYNSVSNDMLSSYMRDNNIDSEEEMNYAIHPKIVGGIAAGYYGIAPFSNLTSSHEVSIITFEGLNTYYYYDSSNQDYEPFSEDYINIINMSYGSYDYSNTLIEEYNKQFYDNITIYIASAGNKHNKYVHVPGAAHNCFTIGGTNDTGTEIWYENSDSGSSFIDYNNLEKPNIVAPAVMNIINPDSPELFSEAGTSFAAPLVTGAVALLLEKDNTLKIKREAVYALLTATSSNSSISTPQNYLGNFADKSGAGMLDVKSLLENSDNVWHQAMTSEVDSITKDISITTAGTKEVRVAMSWLKKYEGNTGYLTNYDLNVYFNGNLIGTSDLLNNNSELVISEIDGTGTLTIEVVTTNFQGNDGQFIGAAWVIE